MRYFFDTEFHEYVHRGTPTIELISIGIVAEDGRELYDISRHFGWADAYANKWLRQNVLKPIYEEMTGDVDNERWQKDGGVWDLLNLFGNAVDKKGCTNEQIRDDIIAFVGDDPKPQFYAYYADYDWVAFCWLFGRMIDLPKGFPMYCRDLKQMIDEFVDKDNLFIPPSGLLTLDDLKQHPDYPKQANEHNALDDARWNRDLYDFLRNLQK